MLNSRLELTSITLRNIENGKSFKIMKLKDINKPSIDKERIINQIASVQNMLADNPGVNDIMTTNQWLSEFRFLVYELCLMYGQLKAEYTRFSLKLHQETPDETWKKYCKTESQTDDFISAQFEMMDQLNQMKILCEKYLPQVSPEYLTLVSALKKQL